MENKIEARNQMLTLLANLNSRQPNVTVSEYYSQSLTFMPPGVAKYLSTFDDSPALEDLRYLFV